MKPSDFKTPGVYTKEKNAFPNSVVSVPTAVAAFIGYTPQAMFNGKSYMNVPTRVTSFAEFQTIFCYPDPAPPERPAKQYHPEYYFVKEKSKPEKGNYMVIGSDYYSIVPDPNTIYYLYNCIKMFYQNGGRVAYIVSVGTYGKPSKSPMTPGDQIVNTNVKLDDLLGGLALLKKELEPTMYICPEATLLPLESNGKLMQEMLLQNNEIQTAISIFDIIGGRNPDPVRWTEDITTFRNNTGSDGLNYGVAYYPFIGTTVMQTEDIDYTNFFGGDVPQLEPLLNPPEAPNHDAATILAKIIKPSGAPLTVSQNNKNLIYASRTYKTMVKHVLVEANLLPPGGAMAGVISRTDNEVGPWQAPANTSIADVSDLPIRLSEAQQGILNVDAVSGKSINAIRFFKSLGFLVWGAKTLDGNSQDWRYLSVRRTMTFLEQSCKLATQAYVFEPNVENTWETVQKILSNFLISIWKQGGLQGATPADAFSVACGLGSTMTPEDLQAGYMRVTVKVAVTHPAEFMVFSFGQEMAKS